MVLVATIKTQLDAHKSRIHHPHNLKFTNSHVTASGPNTCTAYIFIIPVKFPLFIKTKEFFYKLHDNYLWSKYYKSSTLPQHVPVSKHIQTKVEQKITKYGGEPE